MKFHLPIVILLASLAFANSYAQNVSKTGLIDKDKSDYEQNVFNSAFDQTDDTLESARKLYDRIPEKLPDWLFLPDEQNKVSRIIGISDPNMNKEEAFKQATLRAKAMFALFNYSNTSNITDDYTNLVESGKYSLYTTKFQDFSVTKVKLPYNNSDITIIDTFYTKYEEAIVLIEFNYQDYSPNHPDTLHVKAEHLQVFTERDFKKEKIDFFNLAIKDKIHTDTSELVSQYNYRVVNKEFDISSIHGNQIISFKDRSYNYRTEINFLQDSLDIDYNFHRLSQGLWNGYITGILSCFSNLSKDLASNVKNSNDFYTLQNQGLIRTVSRNKLVFQFHHFKLLNNQFYIDIQAYSRE
jgi:hypothetical protein